MPDQPAEEVVGSPGHPGDAAGSPTPAALPRRLAQLVIGCVVLGAGVAVLLDAALGSDGYSTLMSGLTSTSGLPFVVVNGGVGILLIALAWSRGLRPGVGTIVQTVVVGGTVSAVSPLLPTPSGLGPRFVELGIAFVLVSLGVAGYLASHTGAGPAEGAAIAFDPPLPFRWSYTVLQAVSALGGWALGAAVGPGTLLVSLLVGPTVDLLTRVLFHSRHVSA
ncbi:Uncharacterized membrane protein YczE [Pedococcus dokdonensis]|uniref:Uncharacterized membrane protein YczE n=1 Tax=Pedococcus dokdonensis TaxID=443156 RepID=A0A1H0MPW0_9MICO|nr:hypothetical protein [Pedococcus dokdonensis]SDO82325.1 Uncharacterized membrane protein YczE [Pedococcus dokdonensis]